MTNPNWYGGLEAQARAAETGIDMLVQKHGEEKGEVRPRGIGLSVSARGALMGYIAVDVTMWEMRISFEPYEGRLRHNRRTFEQHVFLPILKKELSKGHADVITKGAPFVNIKLGRLRNMTDSDLVGILETFYNSAQAATFAFTSPEVQEVYKEIDRKRSMIAQKALEVAEAYERRSQPEKGSNL